MQVAVWALSNDLNNLVDDVRIFEICPVSRQSMTCYAVLAGKFAKFTLMMAAELDKYT